MTHSISLALLDHTFHKNIPTLLKSLKIDFEALERSLEIKTNKEKRKLQSISKQNKHQDQSRT